MSSTKKKRHDNVIHINFRSDKKKKGQNKNLLARRLFDFSHPIDLKTPWVIRLLFVAFVILLSMAIL